MRKELTEQFKKVSALVGGDEKIDAISSHHNIHVWDARLVGIINSFARSAKIPVRSPVRWVTNKQKPDPPKYRDSKLFSPITTTGIMNMPKVVDALSTANLMSTGMPFRHKKQQKLRRQILRDGGGYSPINNCGHWYGQPSWNAVKWYLKSLSDLNEKYKGGGYSSEMFTHLSNSSFCSDNRKIDNNWDYDLKKRKKEYDVLTNIKFVQKFNALEEELNILHGSYRTVLQRD